MNKTKDMKNYGEKHINNPYSIIYDNCADLNAEIERAGGVNIKKPQDFSVWTFSSFTGPNLQQKQLKKDEPNGQQLDIQSHRSNLSNNDGGSDNSSSNYSGAGTYNSTSFSDSRDYNHHREDGLH